MKEVKRLEGELAGQIIEQVKARLYDIESQAFQVTLVESEPSIYTATTRLHVTLQFSNGDSLMLTLMAKQEGA